MAKRRVEITVQQGLDVPLPRVMLRRAVLRTLDAALPGQPCLVSLALCDDEVIRRLNRQYRGLDEVTDVLAFSSDHPGQWEGDERLRPAPTDDQGWFPAPPGEERHLGEVVVCCDQAKRQAGESEGGVERELALLVVHGVLHLLGLDHQREDERALMWGLQDRALSALFSEGSKGV